MTQPPSYRSLPHPQFRKDHYKPEQYENFSGYGSAPTQKTIDKCFYYWLRFQLRRWGLLQSDGEKQMAWTQAFGFG